MSNQSEQNKNDTGNDCPNNAAVANSCQSTAGNLILNRPPKNSPERRKFQVSNSYPLDFDQLARVFNYLLEHRDEKKIKRTLVEEETGLSERQVESLVSMGAAMGLIKPSAQTLTQTGLLIAEHDIFIEKQGSLEWCHYIAASTYRNLIWFDIFNCLLHESSAMKQEEWCVWFRSVLSEQYTKRTIGKSLREEVRFIVDAYMNRNFNKLEILQQLPNERLYRQRYTNFIPPVFAAMIYGFIAQKETQLFQVKELAVQPGSPAVVYGLDAANLRQLIEKLHDRGWLRYETTHNLDQIRLKPGLNALEFLSAYYEEREPSVGS